MRISATGAEGGFTPLRRYAEHGFTLVELLLVLAIIGLSSAAVMLAMPDPRGNLRDDAERFAARAHAAQDAAVIEARDMALWVSSSGYGFERRERGRWQPLTQKPFRAESWPSGAQALVGEAGRARIRFDTTGQAEPLDVTLVRGDGRVSISIAADGTIHVG
jgi:general secretion pathway protein H